MYNPHTQRIELSPGGFFVLTDKGNKIAGRAFVIELGFDPEICKIVVKDDGVLLVFQKDLSTAVSLRPGLWGRVQ